MLNFSYLQTFFILILGNLIRASQLNNLKKKFNIDIYEPSNFDFSTSNNNSFQLLGLNDFTVNIIRYSGEENFTKPLSEYGQNTNGLVYFSDDIYIQLVDPSNNTNIEQIVPYKKDSFILTGSGSLSNYDLSQQLLYNLSDLSIKPIFNHSLGRVNSILPDDRYVYFGGNFSHTYNNSIANSLIIWDSQTNSTTMFPFGGFGNNSIITTLQKLKNDIILFSGKFSTLDNDEILHLQYNTTEHQSLSQILAQNASSFELEQQISLLYSSWNSTPSSATVNSGSLSCLSPDTDSWFVPETSGILALNLPIYVTPSKLRIYNSPNEDNDVATFRITPNNPDSILNLTYVDPEDGEVKFCDAFCPLFNRKRLVAASQNTTSSKYSYTLVNNNTTDIKWSSEYQEFVFVNSISMSTINFVALSSYGQNVALAGFELFRDYFTTYANNTLNQPEGCSSLNVSSQIMGTSFASLSDGDWYTPIPNADYLAYNYVQGINDIPEVTFYPNLLYNGNYTVDLVTPGCDADKTCSTRGIINVTVWNQNKPITSKMIYQTNENYKVDQLFSGQLDSSSKVTMKFHAGINVKTGNFTFVADNINMYVNSLNVTYLNDKNTTHTYNVTLNGLFEYPSLSSINSTTNTQLFVNSSFNNYAAKNYPSNSTLYSFLYNANTLLLGGSFPYLQSFKLNSNASNLTMTNTFNTSGQTKGLHKNKDGILFFGDYSDVILYNNSFSILTNFNTSVSSITNLTLGSSDITTYNNKFFYNTSTNLYFTNSSLFSVSLWSSGNNIYDDTLFSGAISKNRLSNSSSIININSKESLTNVNLNSDLLPYYAAYLSSNSSLYAGLVESTNTHKLYYSNGQAIEKEWKNPINLISYYSNSSLLTVGSQGILTVLDLKNNTEYSNQTFNDSYFFNSAVYFPRNSTILVGGNYSAVTKTNNSLCSTLCFFNYKDNIWSKFSNFTINGDIKDLIFSDENDLFIFGSYSINKDKDVNLISFNMTSQTYKVLLKNTEYTYFDFTNNLITVWNSSHLAEYNAGNFSTIKLPGNSNTTNLQDISIFSSNTNSSGKNKVKRALKPTNIIVAMGQFYSKEQGTVEMMYYSSNKWIPYLSAKSSNPNRIESDNSVPVGIFQNKNISPQMVSNFNLKSWDKDSKNSTKNKTNHTTIHNRTNHSNLTNSSRFNKTNSSTINNITNSTIVTNSTLLNGSNSTSWSDNTSTTSTTEPIMDKSIRGHNKIQRGFIVLIGLALALATVALIGFIGIIIAYIFRKNEMGLYEPLKPSKLDEDEDNVPIHFSSLPSEKMRTFAL